MRITEQENPLTRFLDKATPRQLMGQIAVAEGQLFGSPQWGQGLFSPRFCNRLRLLGEKVKDCLASGGKVVLGGAGTSGRLAVSAAAIHHGREAPGKIVGLLAGGMGAFFEAREGVEDAPKSGEADLLGVLGGDEPLVYIGISCGLSAAYVAGQVRLALKRPNSFAAVLGFNRLEDASERPLPGLGESFAQILNRVVRAPNGMLLNPIIGPEPIAGSTRMKGGSATKIVLDMLLCQAEPHAWLRATADLQKLVYGACELLLPCLEGAAHALRHNHRITYLAAARKGMTALLDASECPPTFGAPLHQVTALVPADISELLRCFDHAPHSPALLAQAERRQDTLIILDREMEAHIPAGFQGPRVYLEQPEPIRTFIEAQPQHWQAPMNDLAWKWWFNLISTGAFIAHGKVYGNRMIDLRISNLKLWERAGHLVAELGNVSRAEAEEALRVAVPGADKPGLSSEERVSLAAKTERVIPTAILMCRNRLSREEAMIRLAGSPKLSELLVR